MGSLDVEVQMNVQMAILIVFQHLFVNLIWMELWCAQILARKPAFVELMQFAKLKIDNLFVGVQKVLQEIQKINTEAVFDYLHFALLTLNVHPDLFVKMNVVKFLVKMSETVQAESFALKEDACLGAIKKMIVWRERFVQDESVKLDAETTTIALLNKLAF